MKRRLVIFLIVLIGLPICGFAMWYSVSFLPYLSELHAVERQGAEIVSSAPPVLYRIVVASETVYGMRSWVARQAYGQIVSKEKPAKMLTWHLNGALWVFSSYLHFSDKQVFSLWLYYAPYRGGVGLGNAAAHYYGIPLSELSDRQLAALVNTVRDPGCRPGSERSEQRTTAILERVQGS